MRLRYLHLPHLPPLHDAAFLFGREEALGRSCAVHFVAGVNGTGKSHVLQAITESLLRLEAGAPPPFPVTLAYDLHDEGERTILIHHSGKHGRPRIALFIRSLFPMDEAGWRRLTETAADGDHRALSRLTTIAVAAWYTEENPPGTGDLERLLPKSIIAYTSGATEPWEPLFVRARYDAESGEINAEEERPLDWSWADEQGHQWTRDSDTSTHLSADERERSERGIFLTTPSLKLAVLAVTLRQLVADMRERDSLERLAESIRQGIAAESEFGDGRGGMTGLRGLLNKVRWLAPLSVTLRFDLASTRVGRQREEELRALLKAASGVLRDSPLNNRFHIHFDLLAPATDPDTRHHHLAAWLMELIGGERPTPYGIFKKLHDWWHEGLLEETVIGLRKLETPGIVLFDELSDGEQVYLGRMALFHLLSEEEDALLLLDEPETHFNDLWKREMVDIIDEQLGERANEVVIATHSSITLTDVFDCEIALLKRASEGDRTYRAPSPAPSFGAAPSEIMREYFDAPGTVGRRAGEFLELTLLLSTRPHHAETIWRGGDAPNDEEKTALKALRRAATERELRVPEPDTLYRILRALGEQARRHAGKDALAEVTVTDAFELLKEHLGQGHYLFEFRRRLRDLREGDDAS